jgi:thiamine biosynthesis lipoprotein
MRSSIGIRALHSFGTVSMDTGVNIQVVSEEPRNLVEPVVARALQWFDTVERICTRFDRASEVMQLLGCVGRSVQVSTLLFEVVSFAMDLAEQTQGAFDPAIGASMEQLGFNTNYKTLEAIHTDIDAAGVSYRDVKLDRQARTVLLRRPLILDLNAVAKGLAIDLAARELQLEKFSGVCVEAGGDVFVRGRNAQSGGWVVGIQHPRAPGILAETLQITDAAVCTSGDYERRAGADMSAGHILDARTRRPVSDLASVTVVAPTAMAADGLSTAAMILGRERGARFLEEQGVGGLFIAPDGSQSRVNL